MQLTLKSGLVFVVVFYFNTLGREYIERGDYFVKEELKVKELRRDNSVNVGAVVTFSKSNKIGNSNSSFMSVNFIVENDISYTKVLYIHMYVLVNII